MHEGKQIRALKRRLGHGGVCKEMAICMGMDGIGE